MPRPVPGEAGRQACIVYCVGIDCVEPDQVATRRRPAVDADVAGFGPLVSRSVEVVVDLGASGTEGSSVMPFGIAPLDDNRRILFGPVPFYRQCVGYG